MKKLIMKFFFSIIILFNFTGCYTLFKTYFYRGVPIQNTKKYDFERYLYIDGSPVNSNEKDSLISYITLRRRWDEYQKTEKVELLNNKVKIIYKNKEYIVKVADSKKAFILDDNKINIGDGAIIYLGKVKIDNNLIIDMPPIKMKSYLRVTKFSPIFEVLNIDDSHEKIYYGPTEGYKGR